MKFGIFLQHYFPYGGLQRDAVRLAQAAIQEGDTPILIVSTWDGPKPKGIEVVELNSGGSSNQGKAKKFAKACQECYGKYNLDTAICFSRVPGSPFHFCGDPCYKDRFIREKSKWLKFFPRYKFLLDSEDLIFGKRADTHIFYLAASEIPAYKQFYPLPDSRYTLLPPWLKRPKVFESSILEIRRNLLSPLGITSESKIVLFVGSDFQRKGLDRAINAIAELNNTAVHLVVCGKYDETTYLSQAKKLDIESQVHILGPRDDVPEWMHISEVLLHPARQETAGMVLLEALTYNTPVLCTENCGYAQTVAEAGCKPLTEKCNTAEISSRLKEALDSSDTLLSSILEWSSESNRFQTANIILDTMRVSLTNSFARISKILSKSKSVCIVGNATKILDSENGKLIDSFDTVIRLNRGFPCKQSSQGSKTDILAISCKIEHSEYNDHYGAPQTIWMSPKRDSLPNWTDQSQLDFYPKVYWEKLYQQLDSQRPSTGAMTIDLICNYIRPQKLTIIGFDFKKSNTLYEKKIHLGPHNWDLEKDLTLATIQDAQRNGADWQIVT